MYNKEEQTSKFLEAINKAANESCKALEEEVKAYSKAEMLKAEKSIHDECHVHLDKKLADIKTETAGRVAKYENESKEQLIIKRQKIEEKVFADAVAYIKKYSMSDKYQSRFLQIIKNLSANADADDCVIFVREEDLKFEKEIKSAFAKSCTVKADDEIILGGAAVQSETLKIFVDDTFDSKLKRQRKWFEENSNLKIV